MRDLVPVRVRDCACPNTPHDEGDIVYLTPRLSLAGGLEAKGNIVAALGNGLMLAELWVATFVKHGAVAWNFLDEDGEPLPFDVDELLGDYELAAPIAERADELYGETVARPLVTRIKTLSQRGRKGDSTSPSSESTTKPPKRSSRSNSAGAR